MHMDDEEVSVGMKFASLSLTGLSGAVAVLDGVSEPDDDEASNGMESPSLW